MNRRNQHLAIRTAPVPSSTTFELMSQLEALASDLAVKGRASSDRFAGSIHEEPGHSDGLQREEPTIQVSPRPTEFENHQFFTERPSIGRRIAVALGSFFIAAVIALGITIAWHSFGPGTMKQSGDVDTMAQRRDPAPAGVSISGAERAQPAPVAQAVTAPAVPAISPELKQQLETVTQDLASVRRSVEELAAQQSKIATAQQQLEQLVAKQDELAATQERMAQNIAKLQAQNARPRVSPPVQPRVVPIVPRAPQEPTAQVSSAPRPPSHPVPPLSVPP